MNNIKTDIVKDLNRNLNKLESEIKSDIQDEFEEDTNVEKKYTKRINFFLIQVVILLLLIGIYNKNKNVIRETGKGLFIVFFIQMIDFLKNKSFNIELLNDIKYSLVLSSTIGVSIFYAYFYKKFVNKFIQ